MENKENYRVKITDLSSNYIISSFYDELISTNIITTNDVNSLILSTNFCINTLSSICTDQFCQLCQNTFNYYINLTDTKFPRIKYYNNKTNSISAVFSNSTINDFYLSSTPINLISYPKGTTYNLVKSINGATGSISGIEKIIINNISYEWNIANKGKINLGNFIKLDSIVTSINNNSGVVLSVAGIKYNNAVLKSMSNNKGIIDITSYINKYINNDQLYFKHLYVNNIDERNNNSVINLNYIKNIPSLQIKSKIINLNVGDIVIDGTSSIIYIDPISDGNFLSYIYGIQDNIYHQGLSYGVADPSSIKFEPNLYSKGIPLTFVILEGNMNTTFNLKLTAIGNPNSITLRYSKKYEPYKSFSINSGVNFKIGEPVSLTGANTNFNTSEDNFWRFTWLSGVSDEATTPCNPKFVCYGNIMSLVNWNTKIKNNWQFYALFSGTNIVKAPQLPATGLCANCYDSLFQDCTNLIVPPQLPATTLASNCYRDMFRECTSLSSIPVLPAITLAPSCYFNMFYHCTSLTFLPYYSIIAATPGLADSCYYGMFEGCTSLTDSPILPASAGLVTNCYARMFNGCDRLTALHVNAPSSQLINTNYTSNWLTRNQHPDITLYNTSMWDDLKDQNGEYFYFNQTISSVYQSISSIYRDVKRVARSLQNTPLSFELIGVGTTEGQFCLRAQQYNLKDNTIKSYCYKDRKKYLQDMNIQYKYYNPSTRALSSNWQSVTWNWNTGTKDNPRYTLSHDEFKFNNLTSRKIGLIVSFSGNYFSQGFDEEKNRILFLRFCHEGQPKIKIMGNLNYLQRGRVSNDPWPWDPYSFFSMFSNTQHGPDHGTLGFVDAHQLIFPKKAKSASGCCQKMFENCSKLIYGPTNLPFLTLSKKCYKDMFKNCTSLTNAPQLPATGLAAGCYEKMFLGCTSLTVPPTIQDYSNTSLCCCYAMFSGCAKLPYFQDLIVTTIENRAYQNMFTDCSGLTFPPLLNSTTAKLSSCYHMFYNNKNLSYLPPLKPTTISSNCYQDIFRGCSNLTSKYCYLPFKNLTLSSCFSMFAASNVNYIVVNFTDWQDNNHATNKWLASNINISGDFLCHPNLTIIRNDSHIPVNWRVLNGEELNGKYKLTLSGEVNVGNIQLFYLNKK